MRGSRARRAFAAAAAAALALGVAGIALPSLADSGDAGAEPACKWFPDIRCGRSGRWEGFEKPLVHPYLFEDPFIVTGAFAYYAYHDFPERSALQGGEAHVAALQLRVALTDRLNLIATKDGYMWLRPGNPLLSDQEGWMNLAAGLKYAFVADEERRFMLSGVLRAEFSTGSKDVLAGGSGVQFLPSLTAAWEPLERLHLLGDLGASIPTKGNQHSSFVFYHLYLDYQVHRRFQPFVQLSGLYYIESGAGQRPIDLQNGPTIPLDTAQHVLRTGHFEGVDVLNLGSRGVDGNHYVTWAVGTHVPITDHLTWSVAYERPLSDRKDITKQRVSTAFTIEF